MSAIERIIEELKNIHNGNAWHGASLAEALDGITYEQAARHSIENAHSIWEIVLHIAGWEDVFRRRLEGQATIEPEECDFPAPTEQSEKMWTETLEKLEGVHEKLLKVAAALTDSILETKIAGKDYSFRFLLRETAAHKIYHTGQIVLLKKAFSR